MKNTHLSDHFEDLNTSSCPSKLIFKGQESPRKTIPPKAEMAKTAAATLKQLIEKAYKNVFKFLKEISKTGITKPITVTLKVSEADWGFGYGEEEITVDPRNKTIKLFVNLRISGGNNGLYVRNTIKFSNSGKPTFSVRGGTYKTNERTQKRTLKPYSRGSKKDPHMLNWSDPTRILYILTKSKRFSKEVLAKLRRLKNLPRRPSK